MIQTYADTLQEQMYQKIKYQINAIMQQREEILTAFIAKYGCQPEEVEQVILHGIDSITWEIRKKK
jgi:hypothetical protein